MLPLSWLFSPGRGRFLVGISGFHVPSLHSGLLVGDVENVNLPHDALQQNSRKGWAPGSVLPKHVEKGKRAQENGDAFSL